ncbi:MAG: STAS domain-containing protein [Armatimonadota bacterium]|nr:STAS domain-containing protein [bacterium]
MSISGDEEVFTTWVSDLDECELSVVCLCGELDASSVPVFISDVGQLLDRRRNVIMDVHLLEYVDSTGVAAMLSTKSALEALGRRLLLVGCHGLLTKILKITRIENELICYEEITDAIASMNASAG